MDALLEYILIKVRLATEFKSYYDDDQCDLSTTFIGTCMNIKFKICDNMYIPLPLRSSISLILNLGVILILKKLYNLTHDCSLKMVVE